jgi:GT2 family glycosyltransferase
VSRRPALSAVVPSRNTLPLTLACLDSLAATRQAGLEAVLVDDAGDDGTAEAVAARHPWVRVVRLDRRHGFTRAANRGIAAAAGEIVLLLNSDTEVDAAGIAALLAAFAARPRLGIAGGALRYPDGTAQWSGGAEPTAAWLFGLASGLPALLARLPFYRRLRPASGTAPRRGAPGTAPAADAAEGAGATAPADSAAATDTAPAAAGDGGEELRAVAWVTGAALAVRRAALDAVGPGPLDERFQLYAQDLDLCLRVRDAGWEVAVVPDFRVLHHHGATIAGETAASRSGASGGAAAGGGAQRVDLLWADLVRWAGKRGGAAGEQRALRALRAGAALRAAGRRVAAPFLGGGERRQRWSETSAAYARARTALRGPRRPDGAIGG